MKDLSDQIACNQVWFRHFGCSWDSPKVMGWLDDQQLTNCHAMDEDDFQDLANQLEGAWHGLSGQRQELLSGVNRRLAKFHFTWESDPVRSWLLSRGLTSREDLSWNDYQDLLETLQKEFAGHE